jgi:hypothetical protein
MNTRIKYLALILIFSVFGCKKPINEFEIVSDKQRKFLKVYADSTFLLLSGKNEYSGNWSGKLNEGDTISITSMMNGYNIMTLTPTESFKIINTKLTLIKKKAGFQKGGNFLNF